MADVESLVLQVTGDAKSAERSIDSLIQTLGRLKTAAQGGSGLRGIANPLQKISNAVNSMSGAGQKLKDLAGGLTALSTASNFKISSNIANQITAISNAIKNCPTDYSSITGLTAAVQPLTNLGKGGLGTLIGQIKKLPEAAETLNKMDLDSFGAKIEEVANKMRPLADEMQKVANGFAAFPAKIQQFINASDKIPSSNTRSAKSFADLATKVTAFFYTIKRVAGVIASWINESNEYIENLNLFTMSMGEYAAEARKYAEQVGEVMGIDPAEWMRNQGIFMTLGRGFGVAGDRAATMSQQLTQLGYDISSFANISVEEAMQKLKSGFAGELEPLRNLGYDLSQAKLEAVALSLGIDKTVSSMTQAEKAQLRYYAIMTQVTWVQGDMARTLEDPANQLRIFKAQVTQAARALGNIFIPILNAVLPYAIAVAKVIRILANAIASLFGFSIKEIDDSGIGDVSAGVGAMGEEFENAAGSAAKLKKTLLGIDELNVMSDPSSGAGGIGGGGGGGFDFELPTYNFIDSEVSKRVNEIVGKMKEWLGITDDINSWSDLFDTRLGTILKTVGLIGAAFAAWKLTKGFLDAIAIVKAIMANPVLSLVIAATLTIVGFTLAFDGMEDAINNGLDGLNIGEIVSGSLLGTGGAALLGGKFVSWLAKAFTGTSVGKAITVMMGKLGVQTAGALGASLAASGSAVILGFGGMFVGIYDAIKNGIDWLSGILIPAGGAAAGAGIGTIIASITGAVGGPLGALIGLAVGMVTDLVILIVQNWDTIVSVCSDACTAVGQFFSDLWDGIVSVWNVVATWFDTNVIQPVVGFFVGLWEGISTAASDCWSAIVEFFTPAYEWFSALFGSIWQTISDIFYNIGVIASGCWEIIKAVWGFVSEFFDTYIIQPVSNLFTGLWTMVSTAAIDAWDGIKSAYSAISDWISTYIIQPVGNFFTGLWDGFLEKAHAAWQGVKNVFSSVASFFKSIFEKAWAGVVKVFSVAGEIFVDIKDGILTAFKTIVNGLIKGINNVVAIPFRGINSALTAIRDIEIVGLQPFANLSTISIPAIPYLAEGGVVDAGQLFVAREAGAELVGNVGRKTAVMNNDQIVDSVSRGVYQAVVSAMGQSGGSQVVEAKVNDKVLFEVVVNRNRQETMRTGYSPLLGGA